MPDKTPSKFSLDDIRAGLSVVEQKDAPDEQDRIEELEIQSKLLEHRLSRSKLKSAKADRRLRKTYANRILRFLEFYSLSVGCIVLAQARSINGFHLDKEVMIALVGSTAIAAIGLVGFIARGLFRPSGDS